MARTVRVEVTDRDIRLGMSANCWSCPIAQALNRAALDLQFQVMGSYAAYWKRGEPVVRRLLWLPPEAEQFICDFDAHRPVQPFAFETELVL